MLLIKMLLMGAAVSVRMRFVSLVVQLFLQIGYCNDPKSPFKMSWRGGRCATLFN